MTYPPRVAKGAIHDDDRHDRDRNEKLASNNKFHEAKVKIHSLKQTHGNTMKHVIFDRIHNDLISYDLLWVGSKHMI